ncbi:Peptidase S53 domain-containing protein [Mycena venus]|uniref:Peptidase S53 domain-containing protein n=1 Tax=Mycena venus TaxID=2733690 RepID=A0A8H6Y1A9_9AGAR|nr:Peptidase S53 domain-containing protein [Mycena venus]
MWVSLVSLLPLVTFALALPSKDCEHKLRIGITQSNFDVLGEHLYAISDPYHERYGAHLAKEEIEELVAPHPDSVTAVNEWLSSHGIQEADIGRSAAGDWLTIRVPVQLVEKMLDTARHRCKNHIWKHIDSNEYIVRTTSYSLPKSILDHVELIQPTTMFGTFQKLESTIHSINKIESQNFSPILDSVTGRRVDASCNSTITITCLKQIYNADMYLDYTNRADLQTFFEEQVPTAAVVNATYNFVSVPGGLDSQDPNEIGGESNLDTQFAFGLSFPIASTFFSTASLSSSPDAIRY